MAAAGAGMTLTRTGDPLHGGVELRVFTSAEELAQLSALERAVWRYDDIDLIPLTLLVASVKCGALVLGAFDGTRVAGFAYSLPGQRHGRWVHWSHMLGVLPEYRRSGLGYRLKIEQRRLVAARGFAEIHWTFDPLQAPNAQLNLNKLGAVAAEFVENAYGESTSPLHRGAPTDRLIVQWPTTGQSSSHPEAADDLAGRTARSASAPYHRGGRDASPRRPLVVVNPVRIEEGWPACDEVSRVPVDEERLALYVPDDFSRMLVEAPRRAIAWRLRTRPLFAEILAAGHRGVGFLPQPHLRAGAYLFERP